MKKILFMLLFIPMMGWTQQSWKYSSEIIVAPMSQTQVFDSGIQWMYNHNVYNISISNCMDIYGKGVLDLDTYGEVSYNIHITCLDGKLIYSLSSFKHSKVVYEKVVPDGVMGGYCGLVNYSGGYLTNDKPVSSRLSNKDWMSIKDMTSAKCDTLLRTLFW